MLLTNGRIYLMDAWDTVVDTLVVRDGRVAFAGRRADVNVSGAAELVDLGGRVAARATKTPRGEWLGGRGWDQNRWPDRRWPTRASLDRAAPHHPVALTRVDGHAT